MMLTEKEAREIVPTLPHLSSKYCYSVVKSARDEWAYIKVGKTRGGPALVILKDREGVAEWCELQESMRNMLFSGR